MESLRLPLFLPRRLGFLYAFAPLLGSGQRTLQRPAVYLRDACFVVSRAAAGCAPGCGSGHLSYGDVPQVTAQRTRISHGVVGRNSERDLWVVGGVRAGAAAS